MRITSVESKLDPYNTKIRDIPAGIPFKRKNSSYLYIVVHYASKRDDKETIVKTGGSIAPHRYLFNLNLNLVYSPTFFEELDELVYVSDSSEVIVRF